MMLAWMREEYGWSAPGGEVQAAGEDQKKVTEATPVRENQGFSERWNYCSDTVPNLPPLIHCRIFRFHCILTVLFDSTFVELTCLQKISV
jgi:hypothetical protein